MTAPTIDVEAVYRQDRSRVFWAAWNRLGNWHDAEDVAQDAFLRALEQRDTYQPEPELPPRAWVMSIAKWQAMAMLGSRSRYVPAGEWVERFADEQQADEPDTDDCTPCMGDPEVQERVRQALATMPPAVRTAIDLYCLQGLPADEIAERMGTSRHAVHQLVYRAFNEVDLTGPEWRDVQAERTIESPEAKAFRASARLVRMLPAQQRQAVRLRYLDRLPISDVAARMRLQPKQVSNLLNKARETVRDLADALGPVGDR